MVNPNKVKKKLPSLLLDVSVQPVDSDYMRKRSNMSKFERRNPTLFNSLFNSLTATLDQMDRAAEMSGFQHIGLDEKGNVIIKRKKR
jgi:hypothetical protein